MFFDISHQNMCPNLRRYQGSNVATLPSEAAEEEEEEEEDEGKGGVGAGNIAGEDRELPTGVFTYSLLFLFLLLLL